MVHGKTETNPWRRLAVGLLMLCFASVVAGAWFAWKTELESAYDFLRLESVFSHSQPPHWSDVWGLVELARAFGSGIGFFAVSVLVGALIAVPFSLFRRFAGMWLLAAWVTLPIALYVAYVGAAYSPTDSQRVTKNHSNAAEYLFTDNQCELAVNFPSRPQYRTQNLPGGISYPEATWTSENTMLRAECLNYGGLWNSKGADARNEDWVEWMQDYLHAQGMRVDSLTSDRGKLAGRRVHVTQGRGSKIVGDDVRTTYGVKVVAAEESIIILYAANPSRIYPSRAASQFLNGVQWSPLRVLPPIPPGAN